MDQIAPTTLRFKTDAYLSLIAKQWPPGDQYDRPYWQVRLICNRCGTVLDSEILHIAPRNPPARQPLPALEREAGDG